MNIDVAPVSEGDATQKDGIVFPVIVSTGAAPRTALRDSKASLGC